MNWNIEYDEINDLVRAYQRGTFSLYEQADFLSAIVDFPRWRKGIPLLIDFCHLDIRNVHYPEVSSTNELVVQLNERLGCGKLALLCDDDVQFGLGRQFQSICMTTLDREIRVSRREADALQWLTDDRSSSQTQQQVQARAG